MRNESNSWLSSDVECTDALRSINLMAADRHKVDIQFININRYLSDGLRSICMKEHFSLSTYLPDLFDRLYDTDFIVNHNDRDQDSVWPDSLFELF